MKRPVNFSKDNLSVQWQYVNRNLKEMELWKLIEDEVKLTIKGTIEIMIQEEFDMTLASSRYQRTDTKIDCRSGYYQRFLGTTHGKVEISMPKSRKTPVKYGLSEKYQRRQEQFDDNIVKAMILGLTGRKQKKFFKSFIGDSVSHTTASNIIGKIVWLVNHYRNMPLYDEYEYLYLDAIWVHVKELNIKSRPILVALGIKSGGSKYILHLS